MDFREWLHLSEMAHLRMPASLDIALPCLNRMGRTCQISWVDMKFEEPPQFRDQNGKVLNSGSNFVFKKPNSELYCIVQAGQVVPNLVGREQATALVRTQGYTLLPDTWWKRVDALDADGNLITQPK